MKSYVAFFLAAALATGCAKKQQADWIIYGGTIYTVEGAQPTVAAVAVKADRIIGKTVRFGAIGVGGRCVRVKSDRSVSRRQKNLSDLGPQNEVLPRNNFALQWSFFLCTSYIRWLVDAKVRNWHFRYGFFMYKQKQLTIMRNFSLLRGVFYACLFAVPLSCEQPAGGGGMKSLLFKML